MFIFINHVVTLNNNLPNVQKLKTEWDKNGKFALKCSSKVEVFFISLLFVRKILFVNIKITKILIDMKIIQLWNAKYDRSCNMNIYNI